MVGQCAGAHPELEHAPTADNSCTRATVARHIGCVSYHEYVDIGEARPLVPKSDARGAPIPRVFRATRPDMGCPGTPLS